MNKLTDEELLVSCNDLLEYNPETGLMTWKKYRGRLAKKGYTVGNIHSTGYRLTKINSRGYKVHRLAFLMTYGYLPKFIDHINHDKADNRIANLRECTKAQNVMNTKIRRNNKSGYKGVFKQCNRWSAHVRIDGKHTYIGMFKTKEEAAQAYNDAATEHYGEFAYLNVILDHKCQQEIKRLRINKP